MNVTLASCVCVEVVSKRHPPQRVTEHSGGRDRSNYVEAKLGQLINLVMMVCRHKILRCKHGGQSTPKKAQVEHRGGGGDRRKTLPFATTILSLTWTDLFWPCNWSLTFTARGLVLDVRNMTFTDVRSFAIVSTICDRFWQFLKVCHCLWPFVTICDRLWPFVTFCDRLQPFATLCRLRPFAIVCDHLWPFATVCDHWGYRLRHMLGHCLRRLPVI